MQGLPNGQISIMARPRGGDWLIDEVRALNEAGVDVVVSLLTREEESELDLLDEAHYCQGQGLTYLSLPTLDRSVPPFTDSTFTFLQQINVCFLEGKHIVLHCRQGLGRAALMAASLLVMNGFIPEQAFTQLSKARGYQVPETEEQKAWVQALYRDVATTTWFLTDDQKGHFDEIE
jgi:protein-tyrosine phosphatase